MKNIAVNWKMGVFSQKINRSIISMLYSFSYVVICYGYYAFIVPIYGYSGFEWKPDFLKIAEGGILAFCLPIMLPSRFDKPSDIFLHLQLLFPIIPMLVLYGAADQPRAFLYMTIAAYLITVLIASNVRIKVIRLISMPLVFFQIVLLASAWASIGSIISFGGLRYLNFELLKVYEFRDLSASNLPSIYGYISPLIAKVVLPFSLLLAVVNNQRILALASVLGSILLFGLTAHKGVLIYPCIVLGIYSILNKENVIKLLVIGYLVIVIVSIMGFIFGGPLIGSLLLRRAYIVPAYLNYMYYDYFSSNPLYWWSQSKLSFGLIDIPYTLSPAHLIGFEYYGSDAMGANTGWIGSGYMNGGIIGMFFYSVIMGMLLSVLNTYSKFISKKFLVAVIAAPMLTVMMSSDLPTAFLNHGFIFSLILFSLFCFKPKMNLIQTKGIV